MGLDYSINIFVKREKLEDSLSWLNQNSAADDRITLRLDNGDYVDILGDYFKNESQKINKEKIIYKIDEINFSTSLIFDVDPEIFATFYDPYCSDPIANFKEHFQNGYLGNGKISIGSFDSSIYKIKDIDVYVFTFTAVTTDMSVMVSESLAVKNWIHEFSTVSNSIMSLIDLESSGDKIIFYKGEKVEIYIEDGKRNIELENLKGDYLYEYYKLSEHFYF